MSVTCDDRRITGVGERSLILGCAFNYSNADIAPFLVSLERCGYTSDLVLLTNNSSQIDLSGFSFTGRTINVEDDLPQAAYTNANNSAIKMSREALLHQTLERLQQAKPLDKAMVAFFYRSYFHMTARYFLYHHYLTQWDYTTVFLTDVGDVIFQANPFGQPIEEGVTAFAEYEGMMLKDEPTNRSWIAQTFGDAVLEKMGDEVVYCAGTIMIKNCARAFLTDFLITMIQHKVSPTIEGVDQAVFNYLVSFLKRDYFHRQQNGEVVLTVANVPEKLVGITEEGIKLKSGSHLPCVVHQYTRFKKQKNVVLERFAMPHSI